MSSLLLLVDLQEDFLGRPGIQPARGAIIDRASFLLKAFRGRGGPVIHLRTTVTRIPDNRMMHWKAAGLWHCVEGSPGEAPAGELAEEQGEIVLRKTGYSFPGLAEAAARSGAESVVVAGVMTHACVREAVLDLHQAGFRVGVAEDAIGSDDPIHAAITRRFLEERSIRFERAARWVVLLDESSGEVPLDTADVSGAVERAGKLARTWRQVSFSERAALAGRLGRLIREEADPLAGRMANELGKPIRFGRIEILRTAEMIESIVRRLSASFDEGSLGEAIRVRRRPHGVVAVITPWNNPFYLALGKIVPAVLCGNTVVWKAAPEAAFAARELGGLFERSGWPESLVERVGGGGKVARSLMAHPGIDAVTITASELAGHSAMEICGRRHLPLQAELGGNNAAIVWSDADLDAAASEIAAGAFDQAGQRCTANRRVIVEAACRDELVGLLEKHASELGWGDPLLEKTRIGPLVSPEHRDRVAAAVSRATENGIEIRNPCGTKLPPGADPERAWHPPAILIVDDRASEIVQEETFGPILVVQSAQDWEGAIALCNGVRQGLAAAVFTRSPERVADFLDRVRAGILKVNASTADAAVDVPFGGWKASGNGPAEHGDSDVEFFTRVQAVYG